MRQVIHNLTHRKITIGTVDIPARSSVEANIIVDSRVQQLVRMNVIQLSTPQKASSYNAAATIQQSAEVAKRKAMRENAIARFVEAQQKDTSTIKITNKGSTKPQKATARGSLTSKGK